MKVSFALICAVFFAITWKGKMHMAYHLGPVFVLEWVFLFWLACNTLWLWKNKNTWIKDLLPWITFFCWGFALLVWDGISQFQVLQTAGTKQRLIQHCILFVYPLLWTLVGYTFSARVRGWLPALFWGIILISSYTHLANLSFEFRQSKTWVSDGWLENVALGPVSLFGFWFASWPSYLLGALAFVAPLAKSWGSYISRTYLLQVALAVFLIPGLFRNSFAKNLVKRSATFVGIFVIALIAMTQISSVSVIQSLQHGDDVAPAIDPNIPATLLPHATSPLPGLPSRFRAYCWKRTVEDWMLRPWIGRGFIPEIPSYIQPDWPNTRGLESPKAPPVAGPHNSFLNVLARMGIPGVILMAWMLMRWFKSWKNLPNPTLLEKSMLFFIPANGLTYALLNVGLESPHQCVMLWFMMGAALSLAKAPIEFLDSY